MRIESAMTITSILKSGPYFQNGKFTFGVSLLFVGLLSGLKPCDLNGIIAGAGLSLLADFAAKLYDGEQSAADYLNGEIEKNDEARHNLSVATYSLLNPNEDITKVRHRPDNEIEKRITDEILYSYTRLVALKNDIISKVETGHVIPGQLIDRFIDEYKIDNLSDIYNLIHTYNSIPRRYSSGKTIRDFVRNSDMLIKIQNIGTE
ncbi:MAG TPA: hypothetical protein VE028_04380 [Nitratidesulfovibrio sp.]|nr:hypothetical protein [Nitratidesulfovibrio sp.]